MLSLLRSRPAASTTPSLDILPCACAARWSLIRIVLGAVLCWGSSVVDAGAADTTVSISLSPESARMIRDWRRAHGLPQGPEEADTQTPMLRQEAMVSALRVAGIEPLAAESLDVAATHVDTHWQVVIHSRDDRNPGEWIVDVGDSALRSAL